MPRNLAGLIAVLLWACGTIGPVEAKDLACFGSRSRLVCLSEAGFKLHGKIPARADIQIIASTAAACHDKIYFGDGATLMAFDGVNIEPVFSVPSSLSRSPFGLAIGKIACHKDGPLWVSWREGLSQWDQGKVSHYAARDLPGIGNIGEVVSLAARSDGSVWLSSQASHYVLSSSGGRRIGSGAGLVAVAPDGSLVLAQDRTILVFRDENASPKSSPGPGQGYVDSLSIDSAGVMWAAQERNPSVFRFAEGKWSEIRLPVPARPAAVHSDGAGTLYVSSNAGLGRFADGKWEWRHPANSNLPTSELGDIAILGKSPAFPAPASGATTTLSGRLTWHDQAPIANAEIQICLSSHLTIFGVVESPCQGRLQMAATRTDGQGRFMFGNVAAGQYRASVKMNAGGDRWYLAREEINLVAGEPLEARDLTLHRRSVDPPPR